MVKAKIFLIFIGLFAIENCLAFNIGPWVKLAAIKSRNFHKLSKITKQTSIQENLELTPTMKTILNKVNNCVNFRIRIVRKYFFLIFLYVFHLQQIFAPNGLKLIWSTMRKNCSTDQRKTFSNLTLIRDH